MTPGREPGGPRPERRAPPGAGRAIAVAALGAAALSLALRLLGLERVFPGDGEVVFAFGDPWYHLRLALYAWSDFPRALLFDPYLNFPDGAHVPWPPLYDLWVAGSARLLGDSVSTLETVAALWPPLLGALTTAAVAAVAGALGGPRLALAAGLLHAVLPASVAVSRVGYADHHAAVAALGAVWLWLQTRSFGARGGVAAAALAAGLAAVRAALVLTWAGSLAYLAVADGSLVGVATARGCRRALGVQAASALGSAALLAPVAWRAHGQTGGPFSAVELSWLHVLACVALALWAAGTAVWTARAGASPGRRLAGSAALAVGLGALALVPGPVRTGLLGGGSFVATTDAWALWSATNPEQLPLWSGGFARSWGVTLLGHLAWLVPAVPLAAGLVAWRRRDPGPLWMVAAWSAGFGVLALSQARFAGDLAPSFAVATAATFAAAGAALRTRTGAPRRWVGAGVVALVALLLWPTWTREHGPAFARAAAALSDPAAARAAALRAPEASIQRFARRVRSLTPDTDGFLDPGTPAYGVVADPSLGHALHYAARRATPSDNFGPHIGAENVVATLQVLLGPPDGATLETLARLRGRYVLTSWQPRWQAGSLMQRLHEEDGRAADALPALARFRLVTEGPEDGLPLAALFGPVPGGAVAYKLFEVVEGARTVVEAPPGARVHARLAIETPGGRRFVHRGAARADETGRAELRLPYPTEAPADPRRARAAGAWRLRVRDAAWEVRVAEEDVRAGRRVRAVPVAGAPDDPADAGPDERAEPPPTASPSR